MKLLDLLMWTAVAAVGCTGVDGPVGPDGDEGPPGRTGDPGPAGPAGPRGAEGEAGASGATGPVGPVGPDGVVGPVGPQGAVGLAGFTGPMGPVGPAGPQGAAGPLGPPGAAGPRGVAGPVGGVGSIDTGCPGPRIDGVCVVDFSNYNSRTFTTAALTCAIQKADLCTDSQSWPVSVGSWQNQMLRTTLMTVPHWTASFADDDGGQWYGVSTGVGDDHGPDNNYGYVCCGGTTPPEPRVTPESINGVKVLAIHDRQDTMWPGAVGRCLQLGGDICSDSQTAVIRSVGRLTVPTWTNSHADNDGGQWFIANGGTNDDTNPYEQYGYACCASTARLDLSCPVPRLFGLCAPIIHNIRDTDFMTAANVCAGAGADLCSISQSAVLRTIGMLNVGVWTNSHSDNDGNNAYRGVGPGVDDNPDPSHQLGFACCLK